MLVVSSKPHEAHIYPLGKLEIDLNKSLRLLTIGTLGLMNLGECLNEFSFTEATEVEAEIQLLQKTPCQILYLLATSLLIEHV